MQIAAIEFAGQRYHVEYQPKPYEPHSAVTQLIQGIYHEFPNQARAILRERIRVNYQPSLMCLAMIQVAAKRYKIEQDLQLSLSSQALQFVAEPLNSVSTANDFTSLSQWLAAPMLRDDKLKFSQNRAVKAFLTDVNRSYFLTACNNNSLNKTLHAEIILLQAYYQKYQRGFNEKTELYVSLQSCKMCAAMYWHMHSDPITNLRSYYLQPDTGPVVRNSILKANSASRRECCKDENYRQQLVEFAL